MTMQNEPVRHCTHDFLWLDKLVDGHWCRLVFVDGFSVRQSLLSVRLRELFHKLPIADRAIILVDRRFLDDTKSTLEGKSAESLVARFSKTEFVLAELGVDLASKGGGRHKARR